LLSAFSFHAPATTDIYTLSLHDALPISYSNLSSAQPHTPSHNVAAEELFHTRRRVNPDCEHTATIGSTAEPGRRPLGYGVDAGFLNGDSVRVGPNCHRPRESDSCRKRAFAKSALLTCPEADASLSSSSSAWAVRSCSPRPTSRASSTIPCSMPSTSTTPRSAGSSATLRSPRCS